MSSFGFGGLAHLGNKTRALGAVSVALGALMLEAADKSIAWTLGAYLNLGGLVLLVIGSPFLKPLQPVKASLKNHTLSLDDSFLAAKRWVRPSIWS
jgi:dipeptide/tripeptide permease